MRVVRRMRQVNFSVPLFSLALIFFFLSFSNINVRGLRSQYEFENAREVEMRDTMHLLAG